MNYASGGSSVEVQTSVSQTSAAGFKGFAHGASAEAHAHPYGEGRKIGHMQWPTEVYAMSSAGGAKSQAGGAECSVNTTLLLRQPLGHTLCAAFPKGANRGPVRYQ